MRWLVLLLILINLAFFAWRWRLESQAPPPVPTTGGGERLVLLSEVKQPKAMENQDVGEETDETVPRVVSQVEPGQTESAPRPKPLEKPDRAVAGNPPSAAKKSARAPVPTGARCYRVGPFSKRAQAKRVAGVLAERGVVARINSEQSEDHLGWWIFVPPQASRAEAVKIAGQLKLHGIKDYRIIPSGPKENAISLGVYSSPDGARRVRARLDWLEQAPKIEKYYRTGARYWLDFSSGETAPLDEARLATIKDIGRPGIIAGPCR